MFITVTYNERRRFKNVHFERVYGNRMWTRNDGAKVHKYT